MATENSPAERTPVYLRSDDAIEGMAEDKLGRTPFARLIAEQILHGPADHGFVIGILGRWGSGKSSTLNLISERVRERDPETVVLHFNPWLFSSAEELVGRFLQELGHQLKGREEAELRRIGDSLELYADTLIPLSWLPIVGPWLARAGATAKAISKARRKLPSAEQQRQETTKLLRELGRRVLVVVDDLDRLEPDQTAQLVRAIKLVADFPNITYLLAYDRDAVEHALIAAVGDGRGYLEKIVQVAHDLPEPDVATMQSMLTSELDETLASIDHGPFHPEDWPDLLAEVIAPQIRTVRDIKRYANAVAVSVRSVGGEVALEDVLTLECVRLREPDAFVRIASAVEPLTRQSSTTYFGSREARDERERPQVQAIIDAASRGGKDAVARMIDRLFPSGGTLLGSSGGLFASSVKAPERRLKVACERHLRTYLARSLPPGEMSAAFVQSAVAAMGSGEELRRLLENLSARELEELLARLEAHEDDFDAATVVPAVTALLTQYHRLPEGRGEGMFGFGADLRMSRILLRIFQKVPEDQRPSKAREILATTPDLSSRLEFIDTIGHREGTGSKLVSEEMSRELYEDLVGRIIGSHDSALAVERDLVQLFVAIRLNRESESRTILRAKCANDLVLTRLLASALSRETSQTVGTRAVNVTLTLPWRLFEDWFGPEWLSARVEALYRQRHALPSDERSQGAIDIASKYASGEQVSRDFTE